jgi:tetratricopeptide (TPR) repeat protein
LTQHNDRARPLGLKLLAQTPHDPEVLYLNGILDHAVGNDADSKAHLEEAVALVPDFFNSQFHLGVVLVSLHEWQEAKDHIEKAIALGDDDPKAHFELSMALNGLGDHDEARKQIELYQTRKKAEEDDLEASSHAALGDQQLQAGNAQQAVANYRQSCEQMPNNAIYHYKFAVALDTAGDTDGVRAQLELAVKLDPQLAPAQRKLGLLLARTGEADGAVEHFRLAVKAAPAWVDAWINLAAELAVESHFPEAREALATALRIEPANAQALKLNDRLAHDPAAQQAQP